MKTYTSQQLLEELQKDLAQVTDTVKNKFERPDSSSLLKQPGEGKWSVAQVLAHLSSYNKYYLPAIEKALISSSSATETFTPGWLGNYFTKLMKPGENGKLASKMQSPKDHRPADDIDSAKVIKDFLAEQELLLSYLEQAKRIDLNKRVVPISISKIIKLKTGDIFRFLIAHQQRHILQATNAIETIRNKQYAIVNAQPVLLI